MPSSRKAFLGGAATLGVISLFSEAAVAAAGERTIMLGLWAKPKDPAAFEKHFVSTHVPLVKQLPGLISYERSTGPVTTESSQPSPWQMITVMQFDSMSALTTAIESSAGGAMINDLKNFASGTSVLIFSTTPV
jgi:uncharacterized protein (TIGR02118 family)